MKHLLTSLTVVAAVLLLSGSSSAAAARKPVTHKLTIEATTFTPLLTVKVGDSVTWTNKDPFPHTVTSSAGGFDSQAIAPGASWTYKAVKKGEFAYTCTLHPTMKATLKVQ